MSSEPSGIRSVLVALRPWRRRVAAIAIIWATIALFTGLIGLRPDVPRLAVVLFASGALVWFAVDHIASQQLVVWPLTDTELTAGDHLLVIATPDRQRAALLRLTGEPA